MAMQPVQARRRQYAIGLAVWLTIAVVGAFVTWAPRSLISVVDFALLIALLALVDGGGSIYKMVLWFRYRNDPHRRELIASAGQIYPKRLRKFLLDESDEHENKGSNGILPKDD